MPPTRYDLDRDGLAALLEGEPRYRVDQVWDGLYRQAREPSELTTLPQGLRATACPSSCPPALTEVTRVGQPTTATRSSSCGSSTAAPGWRPCSCTTPDRSTVCVSHPGRLRDGLRLLRHRPGRLRAPPHRRRDRGAGGARPAGPPATAGCPTSCSWGWASPWPTTTPPGRPCDRLHDDLGIGARHLTVSTVGSIPGIRSLAAAESSRSTWPCRCTRPTTSSATTWCRSTGATRWRTSMDACAEYLAGHPGPPGQLRVGDDRRRQRPTSRRRARSPPGPRLRAHVNLIPLNPTPGYAVQGSLRQPGAGLPPPTCATAAST